MMAGESAEALAEYQAQAIDLQKAMASQSIAGQSYGDYTAVRLEDLDATMTAVLFKAEHLKLQRWIPRTPARQLVWQYNVQQQYGNSRGQSGFAEGRGPAGGVSKYVRRSAQIMFKGRMGGLTHQVSLMQDGTQIDPVAAENSNRTLELLETIEREMVFANQDMKDQAGNVVGYDGLFYQIKNGPRDIAGSTIVSTPTENVINLHGDSLGFDTFDTIGYILTDQRFVTDWSRVKAFMGGTVKTDLSTLLRQADRRELGGRGSQPSGGYVPGSPIAGYESQFGYFPFEHSVFMEPVAGKKPVNTGAGDVASTLAGTTFVSATAGATGNGELPAGTYYYFVGVLYADGETAPSASVNATSTLSNNGVTLVLNRPSATPDASLRGYRIYRSDSNVAANARWIADVADPRTGTTFTALVDTNQIIPGTDIMLVLEGSPENLVIPQLAPLMRFPLPPQETLLPFYLLLYHTLVVRAVSRQFLVYNIGRLS